ncbi:uncharacterized protein LOC130674518 [Microplitis mediator]|uniref:uncharacterized protein LOC130674518 n=1 Tax=Microplitis mediator TaxID=375433 RepID=UPI002554236A|nr:uncharacterized protein LOC130674518 [Microplitis mediator]
MIKNLFNGMYNNSSKSLFDVVVRGNVHIGIIIGYLFGVIARQVVEVKNFCENEPCNYFIPPNSTLKDAVINYFIKGNAVDIEKILGIYSFFVIVITLLIIKAAEEEIISHQLLITFSLAMLSEIALAMYFAQKWLKYDLLPHTYFTIVTAFLLCIGERILLSTTVIMHYFSLKFESKEEKKE